MSTHPQPDVPRATFGKHPWSLGGGGVGELKESIECKAESVLGGHASSIGFMCITKQDDVFAQPKRVLCTAECEPAQIRPFGVGEEVRDWGHTVREWVIFPYDQDTRTLPATQLPNTLRFMWPFKWVLWDRKVFGGQNYREAGKPWYEYGQIPPDRLRTPLSITYAFVATHNHFCLDRGGTVFKQSAPIIKLKGDPTEAEYISIVGLLNSSVGGFWLRQACHNKGAGGGTRVASGRSPLGDESWESHFEFAGTRI